MTFLSAPTVVVYTERVWTTTHTTTQLFVQIDGSADLRCGDSGDLRRANALSPKVTFESLCARVLVCLRARVTAQLLLQGLVQVMNFGGRPVNHSYDHRHPSALMLNL